MLEFWVNGVVVASAKLQIYSDFDPFACAAAGLVGDQWEFMGHI
jgi:hypothetical protein